MANNNHPHQGHRERLRRRFMDEGLQSFQPHEVLELALQYTIPRKDTNALAHALLERFGSISAVVAQKPEQLMKVKGIGEQSAVFLTMLPKLMAYIQSDRWVARPQLKTMRDAGSYCTTLFDDDSIESVVAICLDTHMQVLGSRTLFTGTVNETYISVRAVVEYAIEQHAANMLLAHNHPSGSLVPSSTDVRVTNDIRNALATIGIRLEDHIIVAGNRFKSIYRDDSYTASPAGSAAVLRRAADSPDPLVERPKPGKD